WYRAPSAGPGAWEWSRLAFARWRVVRLCLRYAPTFGAANPGHRLGKIVVAQLELRQLCPYGIGTLDAHRGEHQLSGANFDLEVLGAAGSFDGSLGKRQLVLAGELGKH